jgi:hypothetical protein
MRLGARAGCSALLRQVSVITTPGDQSPRGLPRLNGRKRTMCRGAKMGFERADRAVEIAPRQGIDNPEVLVNGIE